MYLFTYAIVKNNMQKRTLLHTYLSPLKNVFKYRQFMHNSTMYGLVAILTSIFMYIVYITG